MPRSNFPVPQDGSAYVFPDARPRLPAEALAKPGRARRSFSGGVADKQHRHNNGPRGPLLFVFLK